MKNTEELQLLYDVFARIDAPSTVEILSTASKGSGIRTEHIKRSGDASKDIVNIIQTAIAQGKLPELIENAIEETAGLSVQSDLIRILIKLRSVETSSHFVLVEGADAPSSQQRRLTPKYLAKHVVPYLSAIVDIQQLITELNGRDFQDVTITSITQQSPISVSLDGAAETIQLIKESVVPWRKEHAITMARLIEQEKQVEIEVKKAEVLEKRAHAEKDRVEAAKQQEEVEKFRLENVKLRLELDRAKIQLALEMLAYIATNIDENEKINYLVKLLPSLDVIAFSELEIHK